MTLRVAFWSSVWQRFWRKFRELCRATRKLLKLVDLLFLANEVLFFAFLSKNFTLHFGKDWKKRSMCGCWLERMCHWVTLLDVEPGLSSGSACVRVANTCEYVKSAWMQSLCSFRLPVGSATPDARNTETFATGEFRLLAEERYMPRGCPCVAEPPQLFAGRKENSDAVRVTVLSVCTIIYNCNLNKFVTSLASLNIS